jgi:hypothetical protein
MRACNLFISYSKSGDRAAKEKGYRFIGRAFLINQQEVKVYVMWELKFKKRKK